MKQGLLLRALCALLWWCVCAPTAGAQDRPTVLAVRLSDGEEIAVDGRLDEAVWQRAVPASNFIQQDPDLGAPATERTTVQFAFSENSLYMGVVCFDSEPDKLMGNTLQRDAALNADDRFMWTFDPYLDGRGGYFFEVNPNGAMGDSLITASEAAGGGGNNDARAWEGIWYAKVQKSDIGWTIEIEIPFRTLNFNPAAPAWGANFQRTVRRKNEESLWTAYARNQGIRRMSNAGLLEGISDVSQGIGLDVQPYVTGRYVDAPARGQDGSSDGDAGLDFSYTITPQLKGSFTLNTDFAETEVDQRLVNLTRFPLFFPERRTFFLDGSTFFDFAREQGNSVIPFFSRRIGLSAGEPQRIDYGAKLTGQIGAQDIGLLQVRTAEEDDRVGEDFTVFRAKRRFFLQSYAGLLYTRRAERDTANPERHTMGADFQIATSRFRGSDNLNFSGFYVWTTGSAPTERGAFGLRVEYPNDVWDIRMAYRETQRNYDPAVGFFDRRDSRRYNPDFQFRPRPANSNVIRRFIFRADPEWFTNTRNELITRNYNLTPFGIEFQSEDNFQFLILPFYERLERDFEIIDGVTLPLGNSYTFTRYRWQAATASRRIVAATSFLEHGNFYSGKGRSFGLNLAIRPRPGILVNLENEWNRIELAEGNFSTRVNRLNVNTQFSPWVFLINNVQYDSVSRLLGWQVRFRWIVRPGNDVHFVYAQNWLDNPLGGRITQDRSLATKLVYTHRF